MITLFFVTCCIILSWQIRSLIDWKTSNYGSIHSLCCSQEPSVFNLLIIFMKQYYWNNFLLLILSPISPCGIWYQSSKTRLPLYLQLLLHNDLPDLPSKSWRKVYYDNQVSGTILWGEFHSSIFQSTCIVWSILYPWRNLLLDEDVQ